MMKVSKYKVADNLYRCECGREFTNYQSLNAHFSHCDFHHECRGTKRKGHTSELTKSMCWNNKSIDEIEKYHKKAGNSLSKNIKSGKTIPSFTGKAHTNESKEKIRTSTLKYLDSLLGSCQARYNKNSIVYIENLNSKFGWNLQHAENGGEVRLLGYFVDGYDKEHNIVFEYDESPHYIDVDNNILTDKDIERQNYIIEKLNCEFYRYNEKTDTLYKVKVI